jgi:hypothetical protein
MNVKHYKFCLENNDALQFHFWEYINTFILDSHRPFIYSAIYIYVGDS